MDKVLVINQSLRCYRWSWFSLIPLLGIGPALIAINLFRKANAETGGGWNPARRYAVCGLLVAIIGLLLSAGIGCVLQLLWIQKMLS
jgi:hypothetical protein